MRDQLIGTTRDKDDKLLLSLTPRGSFNIITRSLSLSLSINTFENNSWHSRETAKEWEKTTNLGEFKSESTKAHSRSVALNFKYEISPRFMDSRIELD